METQTSAGSYWQKTIGTHPGTAAAILGVLVLVVLILAYELYGKKKGGFVGTGGWPTAMPMRYAGWPRADGPAYTPVEGLAAGPAAPNGGAIYLRPGPPALCGRGWDPAASAEAEALATVGALQHESYGEGRLQGAIDAAYDPRHGLDDGQLAALVHQGATP